MSFLVILKEPYMICLYVALVVTLFVSLYLSRQNKNKKKDEKILDVEIYKYLFITFAISYLVLLIGYYSYSLFMSPKSMKGGDITETQVDSDNFTIISDDIDVGMFDEA
jgi:hypothetical protein